MHQTALLCERSGSCRIESLLAEVFWVFRVVLYVFISTEEVSCWLTSEENKDNYARSQRRPKQIYKEMQDGNSWLNTIPDDWYLIGLGFIGRWKYRRL